MPRLAFKPDASFFEKIAIGAVGARAVVRDLERHGHSVHELENGSTATKMWKDVKRKRVRIPDLVCEHCGLRVESRAKSSKAEIAVSHSEAQAERAWDYGLVPSDIVGFPLCHREREATWTAGKLQQTTSFWRSKNRVRWNPAEHVNYFRTSALRSVAHSRTSTKGVTEASETSISWDAIFASRAGRVEMVDAGRIQLRFHAGGTYTWRNAKNLAVAVQAGDEVAASQVIASSVIPLTAADLTCPGRLPTRHIDNLLNSPERTQRFTGVKLARIRREIGYRDKVVRMAEHEEEDIYVRLEAAAYLVSVCGETAADRFKPFLGSSDDQTRLETVVALAATATDGAVQVLSGILHDSSSEYFLRSAAAWALGQVGTRGAADQLIAAFGDPKFDIREEALEAVGDLRTLPYEELATTLVSRTGDQAAGAAEALRRFATSPGGAIPRDVLFQLTEAAKRETNHEWIVWLLANLPQGVDYIDSAIAEQQAASPRTHFAMSVLWSFLRSWIAPNWELNPHPEPFRETG